VDAPARRSVADAALASLEAVVGHESLSALERDAAILRFR
jgi:hypothetical protein